MHCLFFHVVIISYFGFKTGLHNIKLQIWEVAKGSMFLGQQVPGTRMVLSRTLLCYNILELGHFLLYLFLIM